MNELALFAGAGGGILGGKLLGWRTVCAVEIDPFCREVLLRRQMDGYLPEFPVWDDIKTFNGKQWRGCVDIISGGFPCQNFSTAHRGKPTAEDLWPEMFRIIAEISPRFVFAENTSEIAIRKASDDCEAINYKTKMASISAKDLGADHIRRRVWLLAYSDGDCKLSLPINAKMEELQKLRCRIWETYTCESGMVDGMAYRMDRLKAIGNGQVPAVARLAWNILTR